MTDPQGIPVQGNAVLGQADDEHWVNVTFPHFPWPYDRRPGGYVRIAGFTWTQSSDYNYGGFPQDLVLSNDDQTDSVTEDTVTVTIDEVAGWSFSAFFTMTTEGPVTGYLTVPTGYTQDDVDAADTAVEQAQEALANGESAVAQNGAALAQNTKLLTMYQRQLHDAQVAAWTARQGLAMSTPAQTTQDGREIGLDGVNPVSNTNPSVRAIRGLRDN